MNAVARKLLDGALALSEAERAELAAVLIDSLDGDSDDGVSNEWGAEIRRRLRDLDESIVPAFLWSDARKMIVGPADDDARG